ncbi:hypothetical protein B0T16DRAFT_116237 [Cercophora newfieldiana]|uniref:Uncharacterized protein n=1 Tax=Cercophora newfieldiana TaxID=92897 RepID=A0AA39YCG4_9PEZI|nr:hypothetical protein B0T16DRAFT_116237 [Cercophora newfieldiana]
MSAETLIIWGVQVGAVKRSAPQFSIDLESNINDTCGKISNEIDVYIEDQSGDRADPSTRAGQRCLDKLIEELSMVLTRGTTLRDDGIIINIKKGEDFRHLLNRHARGLTKFVRELPSWHYPAAMRLHSQLCDVVDVHQSSKGETFNTFDRQVESAIRDRCLFRTDNGLLGLGPSNTRAGDVVVILRTGQVPFLLRREEDCGREYQAGVPGRYHLVGSCYVFGVMDGEYAEKVRTEVVQFTLV